MFLLKRKTMSRQRHKSIQSLCPNYFLAQFLLQGLSGKQGHSGSIPQFVWTSGFIESLLGEQAQTPGLRAPAPALFPSSATGQTTLVSLPVKLD